MSLSVATKTDTQLLHEFVATKSDVAFGQIVSRFADLVYSTAAHRRSSLSRNIPFSHVIMLSDAKFDTLDPGAAVQALEHYSTQYNFTMIRPGPQAATTAAFETANGAIGLIQITNITETPPTITFRYKLISAPATRPSR